MTFTRSQLAAIQDARILRIRAGYRSRHRFVGIWAVVVDDRVCVRSWSLKPGGWYQTFVADPRGSVLIHGRAVAIRAKAVPGERVRRAVEAAFAKKYATAGARKYVRGFRTKRRRSATLELMRG